jgi:hypothetical protein
MEKVYLYYNENTNEISVFNKNMIIEKNSFVAAMLFYLKNSTDDFKKLLQINAEELSFFITVIKTNNK